MLTVKMQAMKLAIKQQIENLFPSDFLDNVSKHYCMDDLLNQILVECCKYAYDRTCTRYPLSHFYDENPNYDEIADSNRKQIERTVGYIKERRKTFYNISEFDSEEKLKYFQVQDLKNMKQKKEGYPVSDFQFWEINNVHDMFLVKDVVNRAFSAKNYSCERFKTMAKQYDDIINEKLKLIDSENIDDALSGFLAVFTLEWKYSFNYLYQLSCEIEKHKIKNENEVIERAIFFSCSELTFDTLLNKLYPEIFGDVFTCENRLLIIRHTETKKISKINDITFKNYIPKYFDLISIVCHVLNKTTIIKEFIENTSKEDWLSVFRNYHIEHIVCNNKIWTNKKIKVIKHFYSSKVIDYKNPEIRP